jgi:hypothetical protein
MKHRPPEPPIPHAEHYELSYRASRPSRARRIVQFVDEHPGWIVSVAVVAVAAVPCYVIAKDNPARSAADRAAVISTATPGTPIPRRGPEYAPPIDSDLLPGDGTWIVGKQIKPGLYRSDAGPLCYWERLRAMTGETVDIIANGGFRKGPTYVEVKAGDFAFGSQGCREWVMVR